MQRAMTQVSYIMLTRVISLLLTLVLGCASDSCNNNDITLIVCNITITYTTFLGVASGCGGCASGIQVGGYVEVNSFL